MRWDVALAKARAEGVAAGMVERDGGGACSNPYPQRTPLRSAWTEGWSIGSRHYGKQPTT